MTDQERNRPPVVELMWDLDHCGCNLHPSECLGCYTPGCPGCADNNNLQHDQDCPLFEPIPELKIKKGRRHGNEDG